VRWSDERIFTHRFFTAIIILSLVLPDHRVLVSYLVVSLWSGAGVGGIVLVGTVWKRLVHT